MAGREAERVLELPEREFAAAFAKGKHGSPRREALTPRPWGHSLCGAR
jgi:hypothetical protein